ncbi:MAG: GNAT family N-acetyltransferase [Rhodospirillaceae bacterium]
MDDQVAAVRGFNRFYTRAIGVLDETLLGSGFSLAEARVLFELAQRGTTSATVLGRHLGLDPAYLSRILARFERRRLVVRTRSADDGRRSDVALTAEGRAAFAPLEAASRDQVTAMLGRVAPADRIRLTGAMALIERLLDGMPAAEPYVLRPPRPGDMGWVVHRHGALYTAEYGWDETFEGFVAALVADFVRSRDPRRERCWIAERAGAVAGSVFVTRADDMVARLRMLYVEPTARGLGIGARLVEEAVAFARRAGYRTLRLWTNDILVSARRLYQAAGFVLVAEEAHRSFGKDLVGQTWELAL